MRDVDVPLSALGRRQAEAAGRWFAALPRDERPEIILASPYVRAKQTAEIICTRGRARRRPSAHRSSTSGCASASSASSTG